MAANAKHSDILFSAYDPSQSFKKRDLERSAVRSHAAKTSYLRRIRARYPPHESTNTKSEVKVHQHYRARSGDELQILHYVVPKPVQGNSDPFDSMVIKVTPEVATLLALWKSHAESNTVAATRWISDTALRQDLSLDNKLRAEGLLLVCSALLSSQNPDRRDLKIRRLERKQACIQQLKKLLQDPNYDEDLLVRCLSLVFMATVMANESDEAMIHARMMYQALERIKGPHLWDDPDRVIILSRMYYHDQQCALTYMRSPVLDPDVPVKHWHMTLKPLHEYIESHGVLPLSHSVRYPVFSKDLEKLFGRLQEYITIQCMQIPEKLGFLEGHAKSSSVIYPIELTTRFFRHLDVTNRRCTSASSQRQQRQWQHEIILTLSALAFLVYVKGGPEIFSLRTQGVGVMAALRENLEQAFHATSDSDDPPVHKHVQLWALYIGATWEWDSGMYAVGERWRTQNLLNKIAELKIESWSELREIIFTILDIPPASSGSTALFLDMDDANTVQQHPDKTRNGAQWMRSLLFPDQKAWVTDIQTAST